MASIDLSAGAPGKPARGLWRGTAGRIVMLALAICAPLGAALVFSVVETRNITTQHAALQLEASAALIKGDLERILELGEAFGGALAGKADARHLAPATCKAALRQVLEGFRPFMSLTILDWEGARLCSTSDEALVQQLSTDSSDLGFPRPRMMLGRPYQGASGNYLLPVRGGVRLRTHDSPLLLEMAVNLRQLLAEAVGRHGLDGATITVFDGEGLVVAREPHDDALVGNDQSTSPLFVSALEHEGEGDHPDHGTEELQSAEDGRIFVHAVPGQGLEREPIALLLTVDLPAHTLFARADKIFHWALIAVVAVLLGSILAAALVSDRLLHRPISRLATAAAALRAGDLSARAMTTSGAPELRELGHAFDEMAAALMARETALAHARDELETKVAERTYDLEAATRDAEARAEMLETRTREIEWLGQMTALLQSCLSLAEAYRIIEAALPRFFPDRPTAVYIFRESGNVVERVIASGEGLASADFFAPDACWAIRQGSTHAVSDGHISAQCDHVDTSRAHSYRCMPMMAQSKALGILFIQEPSGGEGAGEIDALIEDRARAVADRIGLAIANIKLRQALKELSLRDGLTGLFNRRYFEEAMALEITRADRSGAPFTLVMVDLDHFKRINDTYGHEAGDEVLREVGTLLRRQFRAGDLSCRLGGEEFAIVLPGADADKALERAEELRQALADLALSFKGTSLERVTLSAGIASYPGDGDDAQSIMRAADAALYQAKRDGRDRVCFTARSTTDSVEGLADPQPALA